MQREDFPVPRSLMQSVVVARQKKGMRDSGAWEADLAYWPS